MQLYTLNLAKAITVNASNVESWKTIMAGENLGQENSEALIWWEPSALIQDTPDGPRCVTVLPLPLACGYSGAAGTTMKLAAGSYLFCQSRLDSPDDLREAIEWFARESWWQGSKSAGPLCVRLVREDGKTALQVIQALHTAQ